jgi:hypothetical protein
VPPADRELGITAALKEGSMNRSWLRRQKIKGVAVVWEPGPTKSGGPTKLIGTVIMESSNGYRSREPQLWAVHNERPTPKFVISSEIVDDQGQ